MGSIRSYFKCLKWRSLIIAFSAILIGLLFILTPQTSADVICYVAGILLLASGIAANGGKPVYGVYSTCIQRAYDQISQDLCINSNAATIIVAWGSVYGMNDVTHLGLYDIPMLANIPILVYESATT